jgi:hypothetical protein
VPELPSAVDEAIAHAMAKLPGDRYATATEFAQDFAYATGENTELGMVVPPVARRPDINSRTTAQVQPAAAPASRKRSPLYMALGALVAAMLVAGLAYGMNGGFGRGVLPTTSGDAEAAASTPESTPTTPAPTPSPSASATISVSPTFIVSTTTTTEAATTETAIADTPTATSAPDVRPTTGVVQPTSVRPITTVPIVPTVRRTTPTRTPARTTTPTEASTTETPDTTVESPTEPPEPTTTETPVPPTDTPEPTPTLPPPTPMPEPQPTDTPAVAACDAPLEGGFGALWRSNPRLQDSLGCPVQAETGGAAAEQVFEGGTMYWWGNTLQIYVLMDGRGWERYTDTYRDGENLPPLTAPPGLYAPERGFGKVWRATPAIENALGWGTTPEIAMTGVLQRFASGTMLYSQSVNGHGKQIYVVLSDGSFGIYPDPTTN